MDSLDKWTPIAILKPSMTNVNLQFIVLNQGANTRFTKDNKEIYSFIVADQSGCIEILLWDEIGRCVKPGDILRLYSGYASVFKNTLRLYLSKHSRLKKVGEFTMTFSESVNMSSMHWEEDPSTPQKWIQKTPDIKS